MKLSNRLSLLRSYQHSTSSIWDIGCDHGQLGLSFLDVPDVQEIHLVDPSSLVIKVLRQKLKDSYITKSSLNIIIHEKRGQDLVLNQQKKTIFIAGMGGHEILVILEALLPQLNADDQLVISPHSKMLELRSYLATSRYRLFKEEVTFENKKYYQIMGLSLNPNDGVVSRFGDMLFKSELGRRYLSHQMTHFQRHKDLDSMAYFAYLKSL